MEQRLKLTVDGQELSMDDVNLLGHLGARDDDWMLAEVFRLRPYDGTIYKGVLPASTDFGGGLVVAGGGTREVLVYPFRAVIGSRQASNVPPGTGANQFDPSGPLGNFRDLRSVVVASAASSSNPYATITLANTSANPRWDLIWVKVTLNTNASSVQRFVRPLSGSPALTSLVVTQADTYTLGVTSGSEAGTPTRPSLPADSGSDYYIPLAFVFVPHPVPGNIITAEHYQEVAPCIPISSATGGCSFAPVNQAFSSGGFNGAASKWTTSRPDAYLPSTMVGTTGRLLLLNFDTSYAAGPTIPLNATTTIDDSIDWHNRLWRWQAQAIDNDDDTTHTLAPQAGGLPGAKLAQSLQAVGMGQSFWDDGTSFSTSIANAGLVAILNDNVLTEMAAGSAVILYVDLVDDALKAKVLSTSPDCRIAIWLDATSVFYNDFA